MATKLTLRLDDKVIRKAKETARSKGVSLSRMVEDYFRTLSARQGKEPHESPVLKEVSGILSTKVSAKSLRSEYRKHLEDKYQ